jgi:murein DD-endopeptidase MepM/ murein hydrolase activator NlpD
VSLHGVQLWHQRCYDKRDEPVAPTLVSPALPSGTVSSQRDRGPIMRRVAATAALLVAAGISIAVGVHNDAPASAAMANVDVVETEALVIPSSIATHERAPVAPHAESLEERYPVPSTDGIPLDEAYPSLQGWVHPVTASAELMPAQASRHFGAERVGIERAECGLGHCGIDLDGPEGRPLVSVADGTIIHVERSELGRDGRSGRYVRIQHDDGAITAYMHMDDVDGQMQVGNRVRAGQYLGTLGATAVFEAKPHCHFSLEIPNKAGERGDATRTHYVDPAPYLVRATIAPTPERVHAVKPAI